MRYCICAPTVKRLLMTWPAPTSIHGSSSKTRAKTIELHRACKRRTGSPTAIDPRLLINGARGHKSAAPRRVGRAGGRPPRWFDTHLAEVLRSAAGHARLVVVGPAVIARRSGLGAIEPAPPGPSCPVLILHRGRCARSAAATNRTQFPRECRTLAPPSARHVPPPRRISPSRTSA